MANVLKAVLRPAKPITLEVTEDVIIEPNVATNVEVSFDVDKASSSGIDLIKNAIVEETQDKSKSLKFDSKFEGLTKKRKVSWHSKKHHLQATNTLFVMLRAGN